MVSSHCSLHPRSISDTTQDKKKKKVQGSRRGEWNDDSLQERKSKSPPGLLLLDKRQSRGIYIEIEIINPITLIFEA